MELKGHFSLKLFTNYTILFWKVLYMKVFWPTMFPNVFDVKVFQSIGNILPFRYQILKNTDHQSAIGTSLFIPVWSNKKVLYQEECVTVY